jgi:hypothetical protein
LYRNGGRSSRSVRRDRDSGPDSADLLGFVRDSPWGEARNARRKATGLGTRKGVRSRPAFVDSASALLGRNPTPSPPPEEHTFYA